jgi:hypothetical protein
VGALAQVNGVKLDSCLRWPGGHPQGVPLPSDPGRVEVFGGEPGISIRSPFPVEERMAGPGRWSETFNHPDVAVDDAARYGKVATVR